MAANAALKIAANAILLRASQFGNVRAAPTAESSVTAERPAIDARLPARGSRRKPASSEPTIAPATFSE